MSQLCVMLGIAANRVDLVKLDEGLDMKPLKTLIDQNLMPTFRGCWSLFNEKVFFADCNCLMTIYMVLNYMPHVV